MPNRPDAHDDGRERLARIQRLWDELKVARKNPLKYEALMKRIRREAERFGRTLGTDDPKP